MEYPDSAKEIGSAARDFELMGYLDLLKTLALQDHAELRRLRKDPNATREEIDIQEMIVESHVELVRQANDAQNRFVSELGALSLG